MFGGGTIHLTKNIVNIIKNTQKIYDPNLDMCLDKRYCDI